MKNELCRALLVAASLAMVGSYAESQNFALQGTIVTPTQVIESGTVIVINGRIAAINSGVQAPANTPITFPTITVNGVIAPGLIDLHNHMVWNVFPRWTPATLTGARYDWQADPAYAKNLSGPEGVMIQNGRGCDMERYAEVKALLHGATSVTGSYGPQSSTQPYGNECDRGLARNLDYISELYTDQINQEPLNYNVFPLEIAPATAQQIRADLQSKKLKAFIVHLSEGTCPSATREYKIFRNGEQYLLPGTVLIHGTGMKASDVYLQNQNDFAEIASKGVGLVWSPHSNIALYGATTNVTAAKAAGVQMAISPDWSPSGSNGMAEEMSYASNLSSSVNPFTSQELVQMATANPAKLAGVGDKIGSLIVGYRADLVVYPHLASSKSAYDDLAHAQSASILLAVVGGKALLGDPALMQQIYPQKTFTDQIKVCGMVKNLNLDGEIGTDTWNGILERLETAIQQQGLSGLPPMADCSL
jgi:5-methylthioadenosine/S-adenosylhomocysteine deaminase